MSLPKEDLDGATIRYQGKIYRNLAHLMKVNPITGSVNCGSCDHPRCRHFDGEVDKCPGCGAEAFNFLQLLDRTTQMDLLGDETCEE